MPSIRASASMEGVFLFKIFLLYISLLYIFLFNIFSYFGFNRKPSSLRFFLEKTGPSFI